MPIKKLLTLVLDGSLDFSLGVIAAVAVSIIAEVELGALLVITGVLGTYAPDLDGLYHLLWLRGDSETLYKHRSYTHFPLLFLPVVFLTILGISFLVGAPYPGILALTFTFGSLMHFVHDSFIHGWGIFWLYPFSNKRIVFFQHSIKPQGLPNVLIFPAHKLEDIRKEHFDYEWNAFFSIPPHPWWYAFLTIHLVGTMLLVTI